MILRRLHQTDGGIGEGRHEVLEPVRTNHIVGVEHADDLGLRRGMLQREPERTGLKSLEPVGAHELKRGPSSRQWSSTGSHSAGSGVLLITTTHSKLGQSSCATLSSVCRSISGGSR